VIIILFIGMSITPSSGNMMSSDDTTPPVTTHILDPPEPDGCNGWYVSYVTVTLEAYDEMSGVNHTYYNVNGEEWKLYTEPFTISEDGEDILIEYYSVDNAGNQEASKHVTIDMDQTIPDVDLTYEYWGTHSPYCVEFFAFATDKTSGIERVEFYENDILKRIVYGSGPEFIWPTMFNLSMSVIGLICNLNITDDFVKFFGFIIRTGSFNTPLDVNDYIAYAYDYAGNFAYDMVIPPCRFYQGSRIHLFKNFEFVNDYKGYLGRNFIIANFVI